MHVRVQKWGDGLALRIPKPLAKDAEVTEGDSVKLSGLRGKGCGHSRGTKKVIPEGPFGQSE